MATPFQLLLRQLGVFATILPAAVIFGVWLTLVTEAPR